jgi:hypothetical protein
MSFGKPTSTSEHTCDILAEIFQPAGADDGEHTESHGGARATILFLALGPKTKRGYSPTPN